MENSKALVEKAKQRERYRFAGLRWVLGFWVDPRGHEGWMSRSDGFFFRGEWMDVAENVQALL